MDWHKSACNVYVSLMFSLCACSNIVLVFKIFCSEEVAAEQKMIDWSLI